jgi:PAS domain S-box-containing protein
VLRPGDLGLGQLFTLTREAVVVADADSGRVALWNPAAERVFGWSAGEAVGEPIDLLISPAIMRLHRAGLDFNGGSDHVSPPNAQRPFEVPAATMRGQEIHVEVALTTLDHPSSSDRYILALMRDVSERRRAEMQRVEVAQLESARQDAERTVQRHAQLVQRGVDDVQRALHRLDRSVQRLSQAAGGADTHRHALRARVVEARSERLRRVLDGLATRIAIESSTLEPQLERVNLVPLLSKVVGRTRSGNPAHKLNTALPQGLTAMVDPQRIEQAIQTLLDHALARCPRGSWIDVGLRRPLVGLARIEIRDFGRPASEDTPQRLAEGGESDRDLALVRSIVGLHGGSLTFDFPADGGVRAVVTLPTQRGRVAISAP